MWLVLYAYDVVYYPENALPIWCIHKNVTIKTFNPL